MKLHETAHNCFVLTTLISPSLFFFSLITINKVAAFSNTPTTKKLPPISDLLKEHASSISSLKTTASSITTTPPTNDIFYLRYCLKENEDDPPKSLEDMTSLLTENLQWRTNEGQSICDAAARSVAEATSSGKWNNDPVRQNAPHATIINNFITPSQILTTTSAPGDLIYCIRAGKINDVSLMSQLTIPQMTDFFLYCKEINAIVADERSLEQNRLVRLVTANDLSGVKLVGGDASFRTALSEASKKANGLYPNLNGPTLLLNLPRLLGALVKVFTPLFPPQVRRRLKFEQGVLGKNDDLVDVLRDGGARESFLGDIDKFVYAGGEW